MFGKLQIPGQISVVPVPLPLMKAKNILPAQDAEESPGQRHTKGQHISEQRNDL